MTEADDKKRFEDRKIEEAKIPKPKKKEKLKIKEKTETQKNQDHFDYLENL